MSEVINICQKLIQSKSLSGGEKNVVEVIRNFFVKYGFDEITVDSYGSITGILNGSKPGKTILFDAHIDTVPVIDEDEWKYPPFNAEIHDGKIYGRGTSDMKGALAAMLEAGRMLAADRDFSGKFVVSGVVHEECFEGIAARAVSERIAPDYVVIGEASQLKINCGQKGRAEIVVETYGKSAHSANPEKGINAAYQMSKFICEAQKLPFTNHSVIGDGVFALTDIKSYPYPGASVIPSLCRATFDRRILPGEKMEDMCKPFQQIIDKLSLEDTDFKAKVFITSGEEKCYTGENIKGERYFPAWIFDENSDFVNAVKSGVKEAGIEPQIGYYAFCTNGSHYAGEAKIQTIGFGPSLESLAHVRDEYIEIDQLEKAAKGYYYIAKSVLK